MQVRDYAKAATREQLSQTEIFKLRTELEKQEQKSQEVKKKYKESEHTWQTQHKQQGEMIVNLKMQVEEWKERFEKLNKKVQVFMKDD